MNLDDAKWEIPSKYRASLDITDEQAHALLVAADKQQKVWSQRVNSPFTRTSPRESARSKALITLNTLSDVKAHQKLHPDQTEQLAEAMATLGRYDLAIETTKNKQAKAVYKEYWTAVWLKDSAWCKHGVAKSFIKEYVFSLKEGKEMPLLKCGVCGQMNVLDASAEMQQKQASHTAHQGKAKHATIGNALAWHQSNVKKG